MRHSPHLSISISQYLTDWPVVEVRLFLSTSTFAVPIEVAHLDFFQTSVGDERKIASSSYALKLLLATDWLFSPKFQSLPATNKKKLARHEIYTGGVRQQVRWYSKFQSRKILIFWKSSEDVDQILDANSVDGVMRTVHPWLVCYMSCEICWQTAAARPSLNSPLCFVSSD